MFRQVENKDRYRTAQYFYWYIRDKDIDYLFTQAALEEAERRALNNLEDIPESREPEPEKGRSCFFNGLLTGLIGGFVFTAVGYFIGQWIIGN